MRRLLMLIGPLNTSHEFVESVNTGGQSARFGHGQAVVIVDLTTRQFPLMRVSDGLRRSSIVVGPLDNSHLCEYPAVVNGG
jgi:hypothetical protein